jgi:basic membrane protein A
MNELKIPRECLVTLYNVPETTDDVIGAINQLIVDGCELIIGTSNGYKSGFEIAATNPQYKDIFFSLGMGYLNSTNDTTSSGDYIAEFNDYFGRMYQASYLVGITAGLKAKELNSTSIGYVSEYGTEYPEACSNINAFTLGVQAVLPSATVYVKIIGSHGDEVKERQATEELINSKSCSVIAHYSDTIQPQIAANEKKVFSCGCNSYSVGKAPDTHLASAIWYWDAYYKLLIETAINDSDFMRNVGNYYGGLKEELVDISPLDDDCVVGTKTAISTVKALIVSGKWDVFS